MTLCVIAASTLIATMAQAQDSSLEQLDSWGRGRGWEGVGLLDIAGRSTCTGVLIRSDLVLTAAHCLMDSDTSAKIAPNRIEFRAGWRNGRAIASRRAKAAIIHPDYANSDRATGENIRNDVALLQLSSAIPTTHADPFRTGGGLKTGNLVSVVSFGAGRNDAVSLQRSCEVLEAATGLVALSCDVVPGSSGSPVFAVRAGRRRVVSLSSSLGQVNNRPVSYGMDLRAPLARVMADFRAGRGVYPTSPTAARRISVGGSRRGAGAKFLRP